MTWRRKSTGPTEADEAVSEAVESSERARETIKRMTPVLDSLERHKRENAIYAAVMDSLKGAR